MFKKPLVICLTLSISSLAFAGVPRYGIEHLTAQQIANNATKIAQEYNKQYPATQQKGDSFNAECQQLPSLARGLQNIIQGPPGFQAEVTQLGTRIIHSAETCITKHQTVIQRKMLKIDVHSVARTIGDLESATRGEAGRGGPSRPYRQGFRTDCQQVPSLQREWLELTERSSKGLLQSQALCAIKPSVNWTRELVVMTTPSYVEAIHAMESQGGG